MFDILYLGHDEDGYDAYGEYTQLRELALKRFPAADVQDGSDDIHGWRLTIELPDETKREYLKWVIREGFANMSFNLQFMMHSKESLPELEEILEELKAEKG